MITEVYKAYHNIGPVYMENLLYRVDQFYNTRCVKPLEQPSFNTVVYGCNSPTHQDKWNLISHILYGSGMASSVTAASAMHVFYKKMQIEVVYCILIFHTLDSFRSCCASDTLDIESVNVLSSKPADHCLFYHINDILMTY